MSNRSTSKPARPEEWSGVLVAYPCAITLAAFVFAVPMSLEDFSVSNFLAWLITSWIFTFVYAMVPYIVALMVAEKYNIRKLSYYLIGGVLAGLPVALAFSIGHGIAAFPILVLLCCSAGASAGFMTWIIIRTKQIRKY